MAQRGVIMAEGLDLLEQIVVEVVVVRRTFAMLPVRSFLLLGVEVEGVITVVQAAVMADIYQVQGAMVVVIR